MDHRRGSIAIAICLISAALGAVVIVVGSRPLPIVLWLAIVWHFTAEWLGRRLGLLRMRPGQIYRQARQGRLRLPPLARTISLGSNLLFLAVVVCFFLGNPLIHK